MDFEQVIEEKDQYLLISKNTSKLSYWITSADEREKDINSIDKFQEEVQKIIDKYYEH